MSRKLSHRTLFTSHTYCVSLNRVADVYHDAMADRQFALALDAAKEFHRQLEVFRHQDERGYFNDGTEEDAADKTDALA